jgi:hypothetical protein
MKDLTWNTYVASLSVPISYYDYMKHVKRFGIDQATEIKTLQSFLPKGYQKGFFFERLVIRRRT